MNKSYSIRDFLISTRAESELVFHNLDSLAANLLSDNSASLYRSPSKPQAIEALNSAAKLTQENPEGLHFGGSEEQLTRASRVLLLEVGETAGFLGAFCWTRRAAIKDLTETLQNALCGWNVISMVALARAMLEQVANSHIAAIEILPFFTEQPKNSEEKIHAVNKISDVLARRGKGTRVDWDHYISTSLKTGRKKSYKNDDGGVDLTACDLMDSIDRLDKKIKGARKAYEFASEFAHPNVGSRYLYLKPGYYVVLKDGIRVRENVLSRDLREPGLDALPQRLVEFVEILVDAIEYFLATVRELEDKQNVIDHWSRELIRLLTSNGTSLFEKSELCPCLSGFAFGECCGGQAVQPHSRPKN